MNIKIVFLKHSAFDRTEIINYLLQVSNHVMFSVISIVANFHACDRYGQREKEYRNDSSGMNLEKGGEQKI